MGGICLKQLLYIEYTIASHFVNFWDEKVYAD